MPRCSGTRDAAGHQGRAGRQWRAVPSGGEARQQHLNMEAQPAPDQMEWTTTGYTQPAPDQMECTTTGYTQAAMKKEYSTYASTRARSAIAPDTMVHAVAANCACMPLLSALAHGQTLCAQRCGHLPVSVLEVLAECDHASVPLSKWRAGNARRPTWNVCRAGDQCHKAAVQMPAALWWRKGQQSQAHQEGSPPTRRPRRHRA